MGRRCITLGFAITASIPASPAYTKESYGSFAQLVVLCREYPSGAEPLKWKQLGIMLSAIVHLLMVDIISDRADNHQYAAAEIRAHIPSATVCLHVTPRANISVLDSGVAVIERFWKWMDDTGTVAGQDGF